MVGCIEVAVPVVDCILDGIGAVVVGRDGIVGAIGVVCW